MKARYTGFLPLFIGIVLSSHFAAIPAVSTSEVNTIRRNLNVGNVEPIRNLLAHSPGQAERLASTLLAELSSSERVATGLALKVVFLALEFGGTIKEHISPRLHDLKKWRFYDMFANLEVSINDLREILRLDTRLREFLQIYVAFATLLEFTAKVVVEKCQRRLECEDAQWLMQRIEFCQEVYYGKESRSTTVSPATFLLRSFPDILGREGAAMRLLVDDMGADVEAVGSHLMWFAIREKAVDTAAFLVCRGFSIEIARKMENTLSRRTHARSQAESRSTSKQRIAPSLARLTKVFKSTSNQAQTSTDSSLETSSSFIDEVCLRVSCDRQKSAFNS